MVFTEYKGVVLVIIDKNMYIDKCVALHNDEKVYHECRQQITSIHSNMLKQCLDLKNYIKLKFKDHYIKLCPAGDNSLTARFYG